MHIVILAVGAWVGVNLLLVAGLWVIAGREDRKRSILKQLEG
jgi:hypothetical protein